MKIIIAIFACVMMMPIALIVVGFDVAKCWIESKIGL